MTPDRDAVRIELDDNASAVTAAKILGRLVREELKRLPPEPAHTVCHNCGMHYGTRRLPIAYEQAGCVLCLMGMLPREEVMRLYPEEYATAG